MIPATKTCPTCSREFGPDGIRPSRWRERIYCSKACQDTRAGMPPEPKPCAQCGELFGPRPKEQRSKFAGRRYCSLSCVGRIPNDRRRVVREPCEVCHKRPRRRKCRTCCHELCTAELRRRNALNLVAQGRIVPPPPMEAGRQRKAPTCPTTAEAKRRDEASMPSRVCAACGVGTLSARALRSLEQECTAEFRARVLAGLQQGGERA